MSSDVKIRYFNESGNVDNPTIFVFVSNEIPTFDALKDGVAWRVMPDIGKGSYSEFMYPIETTVQAMWGGYNKTEKLKSSIGKRYTCSKDNTGIVLKPDGNALQNTAIELKNNVNVVGGVQAQLCKDGKIIMTKNIVAYDQKATFVLHPKLYWGVASEIQEGQELSSAVLNSDQFTPISLEGLSEIEVVLRGNAKEGYRFDVRDRK